MDLRRVFLAYLEGPSSILVKNKTYSILVDLSIFPCCPSLGSLGKLLFEFSDFQLGSTLLGLALAKLGSTLLGLGSALVGLPPEGAEGVPWQREAVPSPKAARSAAPPDRPKIGAFTARTKARVRGNTDAPGTEWMN